MGLYDVDKSSDDRGSPSPNKHDQLPVDSVMAKQTISHAYRTGSTSQPQLRMVLKNNLLLTYDTNNLITSVYGYVPGANSTTPVLIIAKAGKDVFTDVLGIARPAGL